jgi:hypothetical protein
MFAAIFASIVMSTRGLYLFPIPLLVGYVAACLMNYRGRHAFWPWDLKRRKIERWRWLADSRAGEEA